MSDNPIPLLPCPWCGSTNLGMEFAGSHDYAAVECLDCDSQGPAFTTDRNHDTAIELEAVAAWNKGPYADREEAHAQALRDHANELTAKAQEHLTKAAELEARAAKALENKAANMRHEALQLAGECEG